MKKIFFLGCMILLFATCSRKINYPALITVGSIQPMVFVGVDIFNGYDSVLIRKQDVYTVNGKIESIQPTGAKPIPADFTVIQAFGKTLMPGLIDAHVHLSGNGSVPWDKYKTDLDYNLQAYLYAGITTVYDLGGLANVLEAAERKVETGKLAGPRIFHTHLPITVPHSHPIPISEEMLSWPLNKMVNGISPTIKDVADANKLVKSYQNKGVDYIKVIVDQMPPGSPEMSFDLLKAMVDASHAAGYKVFVHVGSPQNAVEAVRAGADILAHGIWRGKLSESDAKEIAQSGIPIIYTLAGFHNVSEIHACSFSPSGLDQKLVPAQILNPVTGAKGKDVERETMAMAAFFADAGVHAADLKPNFEMLRRKGARIMVGTDSSLPGTYAGATYVQELQMLQDWGLSPFEILRAATFENAHLFLENPTFGSVEVGQAADLLLVNGNPLEDIQRVVNPVMVLAKGKAIQRVGE